MRCGNESLISLDIVNAIGNDWKRTLAGIAFAGLSKHPEWDGQSVSFRFIPITQDDKEVGINVQSYFDIEERK